ncbi:hypothetical protein Ddye_003383 [Dipteronia dyeriana]|uniref:F-box domain-containing protein n=1 Tax=Dipteronia dyeriana TaxID=168575 RepID=A0AAE0CVE9_9ROSI|nr:hypothetical protein Ddye_003383 [Dipteronia dyeriana]
MKLRLRSIQSGETLRIQIPSPSTFQQLQQLLSQTISESPSSLRFSLNRRDELHAPSPQASLQSLGVASGDLIYYSLDPTAFVSETLVENIQQPISGKADNPQDFETPDAKSSEQETPVQDSEFKENPIQETLNFEGNQETLEVCGMDIDDGTVDLLSKKMSEPYFLRVLREELGDDFSAHKLLVIAVHGILLESGFAGFDKVSGTRVDRIRIPDRFPSTNSAMSLWYTLPELFNNSSDNSTECIVLKFHCIGDLINVYGSLAKDDPWLHKVFLNKNKFAPIIASVWADSIQKDAVDDREESKKLYPENEMFEFWKMVKDGLALPLLIDICERTGLNLPPCMMRLPTELKLKILESLHAVDIAKMGCVCTEMRYLASNNDLWKQKYAEEFGGVSDVEATTSNWKRRFSMYWDENEKRKRIPRFHPRAGMPFYAPARRDPYPFWYPLLIRDPEYMGQEPFGRPDRQFPRSRGRRNFSPICGWGV